MIVDTHVHPISDDRQRYPLAPGRLEAEDWDTRTHLTGPALRVLMDQAGVDGAVLVSAYTAYAYDNSYAADAALEAPGRFVGACRIDPLLPDAPETLRYWVEQRGVCGVRLGTAEPGVDPTCAAAQALGIPVAFQVKRSEIQQVQAVARRFPDLPVILDHLAHPLVADGPPYRAAAAFFGLAETPNLYLKFSSLNLREAAEGDSTPRAFMETLVDRFGPSRLTWGSDFPHSAGGPEAPYGELVDLVRTALAGLSSADREQALAGTALALYPTLAGSGQR